LFGVLSRGKSLKKKRFLGRRKGGYKPDSFPVLMLTADLLFLTSTGAEKRKREGARVKASEEERGKC